MRKSTMKYTFQVGVLMFAMAFIYQNCGDLDPNLDSPTEEQDSKLQKSSLGPSDTQGSVELLLENQWVLIDMTTSKVLDGGGFTELKDKCFDEQTYQDWEELVLENSVCQINHHVPKEALCTMIYKMPYLKIPVKGQSQKVALGEERSGCPDKTYEFCNDPQVAQDFLSSLKAEKSFADCP